MLRRARFNFGRQATLDRKAATQASDECHRRALPRLLTACHVQPVNTPIDHVETLAKTEGESRHEH